jgi:hypothetical protein
MERLLISGFGLAVALIGGYAWFSPSPVVARSATPVRNAENPRNTAPPGPAKELADLRREVDWLKANKIEPVSRSGGPPAPPKQPRDPKEQFANTSAVVERHRQKLDNVLAGQDRDPRWAGDTERSVETIMAKRSGNKLEGVTCAATMCRVVMRHDSQEAKNDLLHSLAREEPFARTFYSYDGLVTTMFIAKEGERLPDLTD